MFIVVATVSLGIVIRIVRSEATKQIRMANHVRRPRLGEAVRARVLTLVSRAHAQTPNSKP